MPSISAIAQRPLVAAAILVGQTWHAGHRPDLPSLSNQDPSAVLGSPTSPPLKVVLLGDSSVTAPGVEPLDDCWARRVGHRLASTHHVNLVSIAVGGSRGADVLRYQVASALAEEPDIALVCVGANDALRAVSVQDFERDLKEVLSRLSERIPAVGVSGLGDLGPLPRLPRSAAPGPGCAPGRSTGRSPGWHTISTFRKRRRGVRCSRPLSTR